MHYTFHIRVKTKGNIKDTIATYIQTKVFIETDLHWREQGCAMGVNREVSK